VRVAERPSRLRQIALALEASLLSESLADFAKAAWHVLEPGAQLKWGWALDAICQHLEAVTRGDINRLLMNVPPGCMKSLLTGVIWPAWEWTDPKRRSLRYVSTAHKQDLAVRDNLKCRRLITSQWYQERWPIVLTSDQNAKTKFENENTGFREAMAFRGMTGSRGDRVILDDPLSADDANSEAALLDAERAFTETLPSRVNDEKSAIVVIMQRLHEKDTSGLILERDLGYTHLCLPMRFEADRRCVTSIGFKDPRKKDGELLFPERFPLSVVERDEKVMGSFAVAGQFQQRPIPRGGGMFKTEHLKLWSADKRLPVFEYLLQSYDTAYTDNTANDPSACTVWGVFQHEGKRRVMLVDAWDEHLNYAKLRSRVIRDWKATYGADDDVLDRPGRRPDACLVEIKGSGISLIQELRAANVPALSYNPGRADKHGRASQVLPLYELGLVYVPESAKDPGRPATWARPFADQLMRFGPGVSAHDDYVDTFTQALIYLRDSEWLDLPFAEEDEITELPYGKSKRNPYD
jgi:predicted phage terminase large subunit-like protein